MLPNLEGKESGFELYQVFDATIYEEGPYQKYNYPLEVKTLVEKAFPTR